MTRKQFLIAWRARREAWLAAEVKAGRMRPSERAMALADLDKDGAKLWRNGRKHWATVDASTFADLPPAPSPARREPPPASKASPALIRDAVKAGAITDTQAAVRLAIAGAQAPAIPPRPDAPRLAIAARVLLTAIADLLEARGSPEPIPESVWLTLQVAAGGLQGSLAAEGARPDWRTLAATLAGALTAVLDDNHKLGAISRPAADDARGALAQWRTLEGGAR